MIKKTKKEETFTTYINVVTVHGKHFIIHKHFDQDKAVLVYPDQGYRVIGELTGIRKMTPVEIDLEARKAARVIRRQERQEEKSSKIGFRFTNNDEPEEKSPKEKSSFKLR